MTLAELEAFDPHSRPLQAGERRFACPLCGDGKPRDGAHRCLSLNTRSGTFFCHRCGEKGVLVERREEKRRERPQRDGLRRAFALPPASAPSSTSAKRRPTLPDSRSENVEPFPASALAAQSPPKVVNDVATFGEVPPATFDPFAAWEGSVPVVGTAGEAYLEGRGLDGETCASADVRFCPRWWGRAAVLFPVYSRFPGRAATLVAIQGRYLQPGTGPKMRTGGRKREGVFTSHPDLWERVRRGAPLVVCEAPIDALSLAQAGFPALALCGKDGAPAWLSLRCAFEPVALAFDADDAGDQGAAKLAPLLAALGAKPHRLRPDKSKDWNEMLAHLGCGAFGDWLAERLLR